jgi:hypothetical protein
MDQNILRRINANILRIIIPTLPSNKIGPRLANRLEYAISLFSSISTSTLASILQNGHRFASIGIYQPQKAQWVMVLSSETGKSRSSVIITPLRILSQHYYRAVNLGALERMMN